MKKGFFKSIVAFLILAILIGCDSADSVKVGISIGPDHERWLKDRDFLIERLENQGAKVLVKQAHSSEQEQAKQIEELVNDNIDILIVIPVNSETAGILVDNAKRRSKKKLKVMAYDRIIKNCFLDFYVSFDNVKVGELQADYLTRIKPKGKYALLGGSPDDDNSRLLRLGQMNILQPLVTKGDIEIVLDQFVSGWDSEVAYQVVDNYLNKNNGDLDAIVASSDELAKGACKALAKHDIATNVLLSGQDAQVDACKRIVDGTQTMTVYKFIESLAHSASKVAMQLARDETVPSSFVTVNNGKKMVPSILLPSMIQVTKENIRMTVIADGYLDEKQVFNGN